MFWSSRFDIGATGSWNGRCGFSGRDMQAMMLERVIVATAIQPRDRAIAMRTASPLARSCHSGRSTSVHGIPASSQMHPPRPRPRLDRLRRRFQLYRTRRKRPPIRRPCTKSDCGLHDRAADEGKADQRFELVALLLRTKCPTEGRVVDRMPRVTGRHADPDHRHRQKRSTLCSWCDCCLDTTTQPSCSRVLHVPE